MKGELSSILLALIGIIAYVLVTEFQPIHYIKKIIYTYNITESHGIYNYSLIPNQTDTYDIGNYTNRWRWGFFSQKIYVPQLISEGKALSVNPSINTSIYYDSDNPNYYVDPSRTTKLNYLEANSVQASNLYDKSTIDSWDLIKNYVLQQDLNANDYNIINVRGLGIGTNSISSQLTIYRTTGATIGLVGSGSGSFEGAITYKSTVNNKLWQLSRRTNNEFWFSYYNGSNWFDVLKIIPPFSHSPSSHPILQILDNDKVSGAIVGHKGGGVHLVLNDIPEARWGLGTGYYDFHIYSNYTGSWVEQFKITHTGGVYARAIYDLDNNNYYLNPYGTSKVRTVNAEVGFKSGDLRHNVGSNGVRFGLHGGASDFLITIEDGSGRANIYWNAYYDGSNHRYLSSDSQGASRIRIHGNEISFYTAGGGSAGYTISWSNPLKMVGSGTYFGGKVYLQNHNIEQVNALYFNDPGKDEGIIWSGGNGWRIYEAPNDLSNNKGNLQFVMGSTRMMTLDTNGVLEVKRLNITDPHFVGEITKGLDAGGTYVVPKGVWLVTASDTRVVLQIKLNNGVWAGVSPVSGVIISDGVNVRIKNNSPYYEAVYLKKIG